MKEEYFLNLLKIYNQTHILRHCQSLSLLEKEKFMGEIVRALSLRYKVVIPFQKYRRQVRRP